MPVSSVSRGPSAFFLKPLLLLKAFGSAIEFDPLLPLQTQTSLLLFEFHSAGAGTGLC
jgi:hypothetical protein